MPRTIQYGSLILVGLCVGVSGCRGQDRRCVGTWFGLNGLTVTFAKDGTFTQTGLKRFTGRWKNEEDHIAVEIEKIDGKPIDEGVRALAQTKGSKSSKLDVARIDRLFSHIVFAVGEDGKTITQKVSGMQPVTYTRSPQ